MMDASFHQIRSAEAPSAGSQQAEVRAVDVLVVGAGISGIAAGHYLRTRCPNASYLILEAREAIGGTWDLFRYPGLRSDSDLYTFGFSFRPWRSEKAMAEGAAILRYLRDTVAEEGIDARIRFRQRVMRADWDSRSARWRVEAEGEGGCFTYECRFLHLCAGYFDYTAGYRPSWPDETLFGGTIVHPQAWPEGLEIADKRVVVIGSGATAVTMVPVLAREARAVTMLQRSPSYILAMPARDRVVAALRRFLPERTAHTLARWKNLLTSMAFYQLARRRPAFTARLLKKGVAGFLGPRFDVERHFTPSYGPWDQRLCIAPDGDLFRAIRSGRAEIVTDTIERFTPTGLRLGSDREIPADLVVAATGLQLKLLGGIALTVDDRPIEIKDVRLYKGMMLSGVPNLAVAIGYTNASWTLKSELTAAFLCRLLKRLDSRGLDWCAPRWREGMEEAEAIGFSSGYIARSRHLIPKQGTRRPWRLHQNYLLDLLALRFGRLEDGALRFGRRGERPDAT